MNYVFCKQMLLLKLKQSRSKIETMGKSILPSGRTCRQANGMRGHCGTRRSHHENFENDHQLKGDHAKTINSNVQEEETPLSEYERIRLRNIAERKKQWEELLKTTAATRKWFCRNATQKRHVSKKRGSRSRRHHRAEHDNYKEDGHALAMRQDPVLTRLRAKREGVTLPEMLDLGRSIAKRYRGRRIDLIRHRSKDLVKACPRTIYAIPKGAPPRQSLGGRPANLAPSEWRAVTPVCEVVRSSSGAPTIYRIYLSEVKGLFRALIHRFFYSWLC